MGGLVVGVVLAGRYYNDLSGYFSFLSDDRAAHVAAFIAIFLAVTVLAHVAISLLQQVVGFLFLGWLDHLGGAFFGLVKGIVLAEVLVFFMATFPVPGGEASVAESRLGPALLSFLPLLLSLAPKGLPMPKGLLP